MEPQKVISNDMNFPLAITHVCTGLLSVRYGKNSMDCIQVANYKTIMTMRVYPN